MTGPPEGVLPERAPRIWPMYRAMVGLGFACALLVVTVFLATEPVIERNREAALERAILEVLPGARTSASFLERPGGGVEPAPKEARGEAMVHAGYDAQGRLVGLAIEASGTGYQDVISVLYGYSFEKAAIVGLRVLESRETPGLGDRIETDPAFLANFAELDVSLAPDGASLAHPIVVVRSGTKQEPWEVDGITGATISSTAIADILRSSTARWIPRVREHAGDFERKGEDDDARTE